jgi:predicted transcriptional regulator YdeE
MNPIELGEAKLIGLALKGKTTNINEQSSTDCGNLWQEFEKGKYAETIPNKLTDEILAVYHQYEGDHTESFSYFIGCKVKADTEVPQV